MSQPIHETLRPKAKVERFELTWGHVERLAYASTMGSENASIQVFCERTSKQTFSELAIALEIILRCRTFSPGVFEQKEGKWTRAGESQKFESTEGC